LKYFPVPELIWINGIGLIPDKMDFELDKVKQYLKKHICSFIRFVNGRFSVEIEKQFLHVVK
jgi:hypothetical protein